MDCKEARHNIFLLIDGELPDEEAGALNRHAADCPACAKSLRILMIPRRIGRILPVLEPSPFFYQRLRSRLVSESRQISFWQIVPVLSRRIVPLLAAITIALLSAFFYAQLTPVEADVHQAYEKIFLPADSPQQLLLTGQGEITDDVVMRALADDSASAVPAGESAGAVPK
jgi:anti-sigma factor RsiW